MPTTTSPSLDIAVSICPKYPAEIYLQGILFVNIYMSNQPPTITINDLAAIKNIIDLACRRGAFGADEIREVSIIYERVNDFVKASLAHLEASNHINQPLNPGE
jgi:hypothetical protein